MTVVTMLSGGMDSTVLLYHLAKEFPRDTIIALSVDYGQRHIRELSAARQIASQFVRVTHRIVDLTTVGELLPGSALTDDNVEVPEGHYAAENMKLTVVPNRNMIMLSIAIGVAVAHNAHTVAFGAHAGDHTIYPDCRPLFRDMMSATAQIANEGFISTNFQLIAPFIQDTKADIAKYGSQLGVPFELTWSCYKGVEKHCGKCATCSERREAFRDASVVDPTLYEFSDEEFWPWWASQVRERVVN